MKTLNLLGSKNAKTVKGESKGYLTAILYLTPHSEFGSICPWASTACAAACLVSAGRGQCSNVAAGRLRKTRLFMTQRREFLTSLHAEITKHEKTAARKGMIPVVRLNGTSDIPFERIDRTLFTNHPDVQFYDYTKSVDRAMRFAAGEFPPNYHLTFSRSESNGHELSRLLAAGVNVAVVFKNIDSAIANDPTIVNGDENDLRFIDPTGGRIVGLKAKGKAKKDTSGFVVS